MARQRCGVGRAQRRDPAGRGLDVSFHAEPAAIRKRRREAVLGADEGEAVGGEAILVGGKERRAGKQAQIHRIEVVAKAGQRDFAGLDRAAGNIRALDDGDLPALGGKMQRGGEPVDSGADHDRIVSHSLAPRCADLAGSPPSRSLASADISYLKCLG